MADRPAPTLDTLLALDGQVFFIDDRAAHWVKFEAKQVDVTLERPHGLRYSPTLHGADGRRLVGFDNAHPAWRAAGGQHDHRHRRGNIAPYEYVDAAQLLADFWREVDRVMQQEG